MSDERWPVSIKGVVTAQRHVLLALNERDEWELPGGRLEVGETPEQCVVREVEEESGLMVAVDRILDSWLYEVLPGHRVFIVTYCCRDLDEMEPPTVSDEHRQVRWVPISDCDRYLMPDGYRRSIQAGVAPPGGC